MATSEELDQLAKEAEDEFQATRQLTSAVVYRLGAHGYQVTEKPSPTKLHAVVQGLRGQAETLRRKAPNPMVEKPKDFFVEGNRPVDHPPER